MLKHIKKIIPVFILTAIVFAFLHSETGLLAYDGNNHGAHDYCEIVKSATTKITRGVLEYIIKLQVNKSICLHCFDGITHHNKLFITLATERFYISKKTTKVYLFNRAFLI